MWCVCVYIYMICVHVEMPGKFDDMLTSLQEEKSHLARKADQAMLEAQVSVPVL